MTILAGGSSWYLQWGLSGKLPRRTDLDFFQSFPTYTNLPSHNFHQFAAGTLKIIPGRTQVVIGSPPFIAAMKFGHLEGEQPYLGDLLTGGICPLTNWDDPRSTPILQNSTTTKVMTVRLEKMVAHLIFKSHLNAKLQLPRHIACKYESDLYQRRAPAQASQHAFMVTRLLRSHQVSNIPQGFMKTIWWLNQPI